MKPLRTFLLTLFLLLTILVPLAFSHLARATTLTVTNNADSGPGSLRGTLQNAMDGDTILFDPSLAGATIHLTAPITLDKSLTIDGSELASPLILSGDTDGNGSGDVLILHINAEETVIINHLVFTKGNNPSSGGGIRNYGDLTILNSTFTENHASGWGGAIDNNRDLTVSNSTFNANISDSLGGAIDNYNASSTISATLTITDSIFTYNHSAGVGGAIYNDGMLSIHASTFSENQTEDGQMGGAIYNSYPQGNLILTNSTFLWNSAEGEGGAIANIGELSVRDSTFETNQGSNGGAIYNYWMGYKVLISGSTFKTNSASNGGAIFNDGGKIEVVNSTFYRNEATWEGGGIVNGHNNQSSFNTLFLTHSTFSENSANNGGGIYIDNSYLYLANTLIANSLFGWDCVSIGLWETNVSNLIEDGSCVGTLNGDPLLGPLADNGGPTETMSLLPGSPAFDAGDDTTCAADPVNHLDQRGLPRPSGAHCDIGAYEHQTLTPTVLAIQRADPSPTNAASVHFTVTFSEDVTGVEDSDFMLTTNGPTGVAITDIVGAGNLYTVTVSTGTGDGTLRLDLLDDDTNHPQQLRSPSGRRGDEQRLFYRGSVQDYYLLPKLSSSHCACHALTQFY